MTDVIEPEPTAGLTDLPAQNCTAVDSDSDNCTRSRDDGKEPGEIINIVGEVVEIPCKIFTDTIGDIKNAPKPIPAHALWVDQATLSGKVGIHASVASYHELAQNECLDGFCYKINGSTRQFLYVKEPSADDVDSLHDLLSFLASHLKGYFREASKTVMIDHAITGGIMNSADRLAGWTKLLSVLFCLGPNPVPKTVHAIDMMMRAPTRRLFVMRTVSQWIEGLGRSIRITNKYIGFEKQVLKTLASPHENYSGNSFFVEGVKTVKHLTKSAKLALKNGSAQYIYTRRKPLSPAAKKKSGAISLIPKPSQMVGEGSAEDQLRRLIASHGLETVRLMLSVSADAPPSTVPPSPVGAITTAPASPFVATATTQCDAKQRSLVASDAPVSPPPIVPPPLSQKHALTDRRAGIGESGASSLMTTNVPVAPTPPLRQKRTVEPPPLSQKHTLASPAFLGDDEPCEGAGLEEYMEHRGYDQPIVEEEEADNSGNNAISRPSTQAAVSYMTSCSFFCAVNCWLCCSWFVLTLKPPVSIIVQEQVQATTKKPFGDLTNKATATVTEGSALKGPSKVTANETDLDLPQKPCTNTGKNKEDTDDNASTKKDCGLDHDDLSCSFKMEDTPSCFKGIYKFNVNCTAILLPGQAKCGRPVRPKAWHCHRFAICKMIYCDGCYTKKLLAMEAKKAEEEATSADGTDAGAKRKRGARRRVKKTVVAV